MNRYYIDSKEERTTVRLVDDPKVGLTHGQVVHSKKTGKSYRVDWFEITHKPASPEYYTTDGTSGLRWLKTVNSSSTKGDPYNILWSPETEGRVQIVNTTDSLDSHILSFERLFDDYNCTMSWWD